MIRDQSIIGSTMTIIDYFIEASFEAKLLRYDRSELRTLTLLFRVTLHTVSYIQHTIIISKSYTYHMW